VIYEFDVFTAHHDDVGTGSYQAVRSRVLVSGEDFPDWRVAAQVAALMAVTIHGGMPTGVLPRY
jgi:hypothetical protein